MARPKLSEESMLLGVTNAIAALKKKRSGPRWLIPSLEKRRDELQAKLHGEKTRSLMPRAARGSSRGSAKHTVVTALLAAVLVIAFAFLPSRSPRTVQGQAFAVQVGTANGSSGVQFNKTFTPSQQGSVRIYSLSAICSAGNGGVLISSGPTNLWISGSLDLNSILTSYYWVQPWQGPVGVPVTVSVGACTSSGIPTLNWEISID